MRKGITKSGIQIFLTLGCIFSFSLLFSQTQINGIIKDAETKAAIPYANIINLQDDSWIFAKNICRLGRLCFSA